MRVKKSGLKLNIQKIKIIAYNPITVANRWGKMATMTNFIFLGFKVTMDGDYSLEIKTLAPWKESYDKSRQHIKKKRHHFANKGLYSQSYHFSSSYIQM